MTATVGDGKTLNAAVSQALDLVATDIAAEHC
jgi:hypothetical protein